MYDSKWNCGAVIVHRRIVRPQPEYFKIKQILCSFWSLEAKCSNGSGMLICVSEIHAGYRAATS